jgi:hypothetical protein
VASPPPVTFPTTMPNQSVMQPFTSQGGMLSVSATAQGYTDTVTAYITGSQIANSDVTTATTNIYCPTSCCSAGTCTTLNGGQPATSNLFTMIAFTESTCRQFVLNADKHYPSSLGALWPAENTKSPPPLGSRIGLLMVQLNNPPINNPPGAMQTAWNWLTDVSVGLGIFDEKIQDYSIPLQTAAISSHTGLSPLTQLQLENMALGEYAITHPGNAKKQYYQPKCVGGTPKGKVCMGGSWQWKESKPNAATHYVDKMVRAAGTNPCP